MKTALAIAKFKDFIASQGGNTEQIDNTDLLPKAKYVVEVKSHREGYVTKINAENIGLIAMELGAGRATKEDKVDLAVGIVLNKKRGDKVLLGETIAYIHANYENRIDKAKASILANYIIEKEKGKEIPLIYDII